MMNNAEMMDCMMGMGWAAGIFWVLLLGLVGWGLYRLFTTGGPSRPERETPLETLQRHYASGQLTTEEYRERKEELRK
jgi:putative membrane protein